MPTVRYRLRGRLVPYDGGSAGAWRFITLPKGPSKELRGMFDGTRGFGSLPCSVTIGATTWETSVFWSTVAGYMLPVKAAVRKAEGLVDGRLVTYEIEVGG